MQSTFSMEKFSRFAVGFQLKDQDASRARNFSWSGCSRLASATFRHKAGIVNKKTIK